MEKIIDRLFDWDKISTKLIFLLFLITGILLFIPDNYLQNLKLESFISEYGKYIGITFISTVGFLLVSFTSYIISVIRNKRATIKIKSTIVKNINQLTYPEIFALREFLINGKSTLQLPFLDETIISLENKMIIYKASNTGVSTIRGQYWAYSISEYALPYINNHLLKIPTELNDEIKAKIENERPNWSLDNSFR
ncbi:super-infection exclusion protein B [Chryseobacterium daeguense]|uniref:super-infection exclusion protein B n=1 Tax=Chryseobacterium daeguense TaxID=412438 RepID=UPI0003F539C6|nr:super-infection exclusion protein B [Chryseobacterium daeguense]